MAGPQAPVRLQRAIPSLPIYDGEEPINDFLFKFQSYSTAHGLSQAQCFIALPARLTGKALKAYRTLVQGPHANQITNLQALIDGLAAQLDNPAKRETAKNQLSLGKKVGESISDYAERTRKLVLMAYPDADKNTADDHQKEAIRKTLTPEQRIQIATKGEMSLDSLVEFLEQIENIEAMHPKKLEAKIDSISDNLDKLLINFVSRDEPYEERQPKNGHNESFQRQGQSFQNYNGGKKYRNDFRNGGNQQQMDGGNQQNFRNNHDNFQRGYQGNQGGHRDGYQREFYGNKRGNRGFHGGQKGKNYGRYHGNNGGFQGNQGNFHGHQNYNDNNSQQMNGYSGPANGVPQAQQYGNSGGFHGNNNNFQQGNAGNNNYSQQGNVNGGNGNGGPQAQQIPQNVRENNRNYQNNGSFNRGANFINSLFVASLCLFVLFTPAVGAQYTIPDIYSCKGGAAALFLGRNISSQACERTIIQGSTMETSAVVYQETLIQESFEVAKCTQIETRVCVFGFMKVFNIHFNETSSFISVDADKCRLMGKEKKIGERKMENINGRWETTDKPELSTPVFSERCTNHTEFILEFGRFTRVGSTLISNMGIVRECEAELGACKVANATYTWNPNEVPQAGCPEKLGAYPMVVAKGLVMIRDLGKVLKLKEEAVTTTCLAPYTRKFTDNMYISFYGNSRASEIEEFLLNGGKKVDSLFTVSRSKDLKDDLLSMPKALDTDPEAYLNEPLLIRELKIHNLSSADIIWQMAHYEGMELTTATLRALRCKMWREDMRRTIDNMPDEEVQRLMRRDFYINEEEARKRGIKDTSDPNITDFELIRKGYRLLALDITVMNTHLMDRFLLNEFSFFSPRTDQEAQAEYQVISKRVFFNSYDAFCKLDFDVTSYRKTYSNLVAVPDMVSPTILTFRISEAPKWTIDTSLINMGKSTKMMSTDYANREFAEEFQKGTCRVEQTRLQGQIIALQLNPTVGVQLLLGRKDVKAEMIGKDLYSVSMCDRISTDRIGVINYNHKWGGVCYEELPLSVDGQMKFLDLKTTHISETGRVVSCTILEIMTKRESNKPRQIPITPNVDVVNEKSDGVPVLAVNDENQPSTLKQVTDTLSNLWNGLTDWVVKPVNSVKEMFAMVQEWVAWWHSAMRITLIVILLIIGLAIVLYFTCKCYCQRKITELFFSKEENRQTGEENTVNALLSLDDAYLERMRREREERDRLELAEYRINQVKMSVSKNAYSFF